MIELYNLGLTDLEIQQIIQICPNILDLTDEEISNNIKLLKNIDNNNDQIKHIIISNPFYLDRILEDITNLINKLIEIGITNVKLLFNNNPLLLNKDAYEIDEYIKQEINKGNNIEDIVDKIESNSSIIDII